MSMPMDNNVDSAVAYYYNLYFTLILQSKSGRAMKHGRPNGINTSLGSVYFKTQFRRVAQFGQLITKFCIKPGWLVKTEQNPQAALIYLHNNRTILT